MARVTWGGKDALSRAIIKRGRAAVIGGWRSEEDCGLGDFAGVELGHGEAVALASSLREEGEPREEVLAAQEPIPFVLHVDGAEAVRRLRPVGSSVPGVGGGGAGQGEKGAGGEPVEGRPRTLNTEP